MVDNPSLTNNPNLDSWLSLVEDGVVRVTSGKVDIGQRISTALATVVAEELGVSPECVDMLPPSTAYSPDEGITSGSNSIQQSGHALRRAAATARRHLIERAAAYFDVVPDRLRLEDGLISVSNTNQSISYWELMDGEAFEIPIDLEVKLQLPGDHCVIGKAAAPRGLDDMVCGSFTFIHDMALPDMVHARPVRPPHALARLRALDQSVVARLSSEGITVVRDGSFLAVAGDDEFAVVKAAERLRQASDWDLGAGLDDRSIYDQLRDNPRDSLPVRDGSPIHEAVPAWQSPKDAVHTLQARYERPYLMHGSIGPSAAVAHLDGDSLEIWTHSQGIHLFKATVAEALALDAETVRVNHVPGAGCYGHNGAEDAAFDAILVARALPGRPVMLKWTREDEHAWEPYGSCMAMEVSAALDGEARVVAWSQETYSDTHLGRPRPGPNKIGPSRLLAACHMADPAPPFRPKPSMARETGLHRNLQPYYDFPETHLVKHLVQGLPHRTSALRCLGGNGNVFAQESFMDELAGLAGVDAVQFRLDHLTDERARDVLRAVADAIGWGRVADNGHGLGIAFSRYTSAKSYAAVAVDLSVGEDAQVQLHRAVIAADVGEIIDADGMRAQLEGGFLQAASWSLYEAVTFDRDGITSRDWESYPILRFDNVPTIETILIDRPGLEPLGAGEAVGGPTPGAIANAIFNATGVRLRRTPFTPDALRRAAMEA